MYIEGERQGGKKKVRKRLQIQIVSCISSYPDPVLVPWRNSLAMAPQHSCGDGFSGRYCGTSEEE